MSILSTGKAAARAVRKARGMPGIPAGDKHLVARGHTRNRDTCCQKIPRDSICPYGYIRSEPYHKGTSRNWTNIHWVKVQHLIH